VKEACLIVPELVILEKELIEVYVCNLATRVHGARTEMARVQLELNLHIIELQLKAQPLTMLEVKK